MKCFAHPDVDATGTCQDCGKGLCVSCSSRFNVMLCESCLLVHNKSVAMDMHKGLVITVVIMVTGLWVAITNSVSGNGTYKYIFFALLPTFTYWGWKFTPTHQRFSFIGNLNFWGMYFFLKLIISYFIGLFIGPYQIYTMIKELRIASRLNSQIMSGQI